MEEKDNLKDNNLLNYLEQYSISKEILKFGYPDINVFQVTII